MRMYGVTLDWQVKDCVMGSIEMLDMRCIFFTPDEAQAWIDSNKPADLGP